MLSTIRSRMQIEALQEALNQLQRRLNRIQVETDSWAEEKQAVSQRVTLVGRGWTAKCLRLCR
jgi:ribonuclease HI